MALLKAAGKGDLTTLEHLVNQGVDVDATDGVRATLVPSRHPRLQSCHLRPCPPSPALCHRHRLRRPPADPPAA